MNFTSQPVHRDKLFTDSLIFTDVRPYVRLYHWGTVVTYVLYVDWVTLRVIYTDKIIVFVLRSPKISNLKTFAQNLY